MISPIWIGDIPTNHKNSITSITNKLLLYWKYMRKDGNFLRTTTAEVVALLKKRKLFSIFFSTFHRSHRPTCDPPKQFDIQCYCLITVVFPRFITTSTKFENSYEFLSRQAYPFLGNWPLNLRILTNFYHVKHTRS